MKQFFLGAGVVLISSLSLQAQTTKAKPAPVKKATTAPKPATKATTKPKPTAAVAAVDTFSYALGMNIANNLKKQNVSVVDDASMAKGLNDVFGGKVTSITEMQANNCIQKKFQEISTAKTDSAKKAPVVKKKPATASLDSFSYALGMNIANNLKLQGVTNVNNSSLGKGCNDVFGGKTTLLTDQEAGMNLQQKLQAFAAKKNQAEKEKGKAFLDANKKRPEVITLPSGLQYEILKKGDPNSATPKPDDTVVANYAGTLINGKEFDNSYKRGEPLTIGVSSVIKGWTEALQLMHIGDKWKVFIPSELGYGEKGAGADIPGGATLIFEMELLGIKPAAGATTKL